MLFFLSTVDMTEADYSESGGFPELCYVATSEEAHRVIEEYEINTTSRFSCYVAKKGFGCTDFCKWIEELVQNSAAMHVYVQ